MSEEFSRKDAAAKLGILAGVVILLSGLCSVITSYPDSRYAPLVFAGGLVVQIPAAVVAYGMYRHFKRGRNRATEFIAVAYAIVTLVTFVLTLPMWMNPFVAVVMAFVGGLGLGTLEWSTRALSARSWRAMAAEDEDDPGEWE